MECKFNTYLDDGDKSNNNFKKSSGTQDQGLDNTLPDQTNSLTQPQRVLAHTFIREDVNTTSTIFDLESEKILLGLKIMIEDRINQIKKSPYFME